MATSVILSCVGARHKTESNTYMTDTDEHEVWDYLVSYLFSVSKLDDSKICAKFIMKGCKIVIQKCFCT